MIEYEWIYTDGYYAECLVKLGIRHGKLSEVMMVHN